MPASKILAEQHLRDYIGRHFDAHTCLSINKHKPYVRLLFQATAKPGDDGAIRTTGKHGIKITPDNLCKHEYYKGRVRILPDVFMRSGADPRTCILGEAKGLCDTTGRIPGRRYSLAHRLAADLLNEAGVRGKFSCAGFVQSFLAQPLGYLDAVIKMRRDLSFDKLYYAWLVCEEDESADFYSNLGRGLNAALNRLFPGCRNALNPALPYYSDSSSHYYVFSVDISRISTLCDCLCHQAVARYL